MPLSEHEQQLLAQLEKQLHEEDPRFASTMQPEVVRGRRSMRNVVVGVVVAVVGLGVLLAGVATHLILLGALGFVVMGAGAYFATMKPTDAPDPSTSRPGSTAGTGRSRAAKPTSSFFQNLEEKWDRRNQGGGL